MKFGLPTAAKLVRKQLAGGIVALTALAAIPGGAHAEPSQDLANLNELSRQSEELAQTIQSTQRELDRKLQIVGEADRRHAADLAVLEAAKSEQLVQQSAVDRVAAAVYSGGRADDLTAIFTAKSPTRLIDSLSIRRVAAAEMSARMQSLHRATMEARKVEVASAVSLIEARAALDDAVALRAELQQKQSQLRARIAEAAEKAVLTTPPAEVMVALGQIAPIPTVGMNGLVPNARKLVQYIMVTYPGVRSIGGVRADPLPDHPSGRAVDIMIGSDMALGDAVNADIQSQAARFGVQYTMWRVASHYDHVHITVSN